MPRRSACATAWLWLALATNTAIAQSAALSGLVRDASGAAIEGARISLDGSPLSARSTADGAYRLIGVPPGTYTVRVARLGFAAHVERGLVLGATPVTRDVVLQAQPIPLSQVVIAPGVYGALDVTTPSLQVMTQEDLLTRPQLAEDLFRALNRLPGMAGSDFSARLRVRNSASDEVLVTLDGLELTEPYHMKDFDGALTIIDQDAIGRVELSSGGFGVADGTRAAGLIRMFSATPASGRSRTAIGLSLSNMRARSEGTFDGGKGSWLVSARRGYLDIVFQLIGEDEAPNPTYYDILAKVQHSLGSRHVVSLNTLVARDALTFSVDEGATNARGNYGNAYAWGTVRSQWAERLASTTLLSVSALSWERDGQEAEFFGNQPAVRAGFRDLRTLALLGVKQDWNWDVAPRVSFLFGGEGRQEDADYDYSQFRVRRARVGQGTVTLDSIAWRLVRTVAGYRQSGYVAVRVRSIASVTSELGVRGDRHSWTRQSTVTPRINVRWDARARTSVRFAWGGYTQAQGLQDLSVVDGDSAFSRAERSEQRVVGVEQQLRNGWSLRVEGFDRRIREPRPRWFSADGELDPFPEGQLDRVKLAPDSSRVRGAEVVGTFDNGGPLRASLWYAWTRGRSYDEGFATPRPYEEPHAAAADVAWRTHGGWTWGFAWTFRSGWPSMPATFVLDTIAPGQLSIRRVPPSQRFTDRLRAYRRFDVRVSRTFTTRRGRVSVFAEVFNLLDRSNQRGWSYDAFTASGRLQVRPTAESFIGRLPTAGLRWEF